jgi:hypothetical protein
MKFICLIFVIFYLSYNFKPTTFVKEEQRTKIDIKGISEWETKDGKTVKLDITETTEWEPPIDKINGDFILKAEENIKDRPSVPTLFFYEYSIVTTDHNSYYYIDKDIKHYYNNKTHNIMARYCTYENNECKNCKNEYIICLECHKKEISFLNFLEKKFEDYSKKHGFGIQWIFIDSPELEIPINPNKSRETEKRRVNIWRFRIYNLENNSDLLINDYWEDSETRKPYRVGYLSNRKKTNLHTFETYDYVLIYNFHTGINSEKIRCRTTI